VVWQLDVLLQAAGRSFGTQPGEATSAFGERSWATAIEGPWRDRFEHTASSVRPHPMAFRCTTGAMDYIIEYM
jgi:hypothetical protein